jgi:biopolymer transport protein ExbD
MSFGGSSNSGQVQEMNEINITPFVDVVLVLLVIFIVTAPMMMKDLLEVKLPKTSMSDTRASSPFAVAITAQGQILLGGQLVTEVVLQQRALEAKAKDPLTSVILAADRDARHGDVTNVISIVKGAGLSNFAIQVEKGSRPLKDGP